MIVPLSVQIERRDSEESFSTVWDGELVAHPNPPRYHVTATLLDTESRRTVSYEFWSMVDQERDSVESIGRVTHVDVSVVEHQTTLRKLRDALDEVLGDES